MKPEKKLTRTEILDMAITFNNVMKPDPPIDLSLTDDEISEQISNVIMSGLPPGALDLKPGQDLDSRDIALEEALRQKDGVGPDVFPEDGKISTDKN